ncbi:cupin domain-containing protein [Frondihabitans sp. PAMC 28766]|uniref:cupin domain-containing protein n=1 Tax=Frondihabitans sp. PAMC 28766 TaxID=1795630 RepID=UPI0009EAADE6|nr:cupin domain-containing protein [Frondihabitans sp. PAMC 28766]
MTMRVTRISQAEPFSPVGHEGVGPVRLQGGALTPTSDFTVALSHYLPGAEAQLAPQEAETVYVVLSGELTMSSEGTDEVLTALDSVHFTVGTLRTVTNTTTLPASMLVIRATS